MDEFKLFKIPSSPFYQVRFKRNGRYHVKSLKTDDLIKASERASQIVAGININSISVSGNQKSFSQVVEAVLAKDQRLVNVGLRNPQHNKDQLSIYKVHLREQLGWMPIQEMTFQVISDYVDAMFDQGKSITTIKHVMVFVSKTLKHARRMGWISAVPTLPTISQPKGVRPWLSMDEYQRGLAATVQVSGTQTRRRSAK